MLVFGRRHHQQLPDPLLRRPDSPMADVRLQPHPVSPALPVRPARTRRRTSGFRNTNGQGQTENWSNPPEGGRLSQFLWFLGQIVDTMHNWRDNIQLKVPGFRDRIAQIHLRDEEGGINLKMPPEYITALSTRGAYAARVLAERFSDDPPPDTILTWDNHCWVRLRSTMGLLEQHVARIERAFAGQGGPDDLFRPREGAALVPLLRCLGRGGHARRSSTARRGLARLSPRALERRTAPCARAPHPAAGLRT